MEKKTAISSLVLTLSYSQRNFSNENICLRLCFLFSAFFVVSSLAITVWFIITAGYFTKRSLELNGYSPEKKEEPCRNIHQTKHAFLLISPFLSSNERKIKVVPEFNPRHSLFFNVNRLTQVVLFIKIRTQIVYTDRVEKMDKNSINWSKPRKPQQKEILQCLQRCTFIAVCTRKMNKQNLYGYW